MKLKILSKGSYMLREIETLMITSISLLLPHITNIITSFINYSEITLCVCIHLEREKNKFKLAEYS